MSAPNSCSPCDCINGTMSDDYYKNASMVAMCAILSALGGGGAASNFRFDTEILCVPTSGVPVLVVYAYKTDGTVTGIVAYNILAVPTVYGGSLAALVACETLANHAEDAPVVSGDFGVGVLIKRTDTAAVQTSADGDYTLPVGNSFGVQHVNIDRTFQASDVNGLLVAEDAASTDGGALAKIGFVRQDALSSSVSTDGDWGTGKLDSLGRIWISGTYLEDVPAVSGDQGHPALFIRTDTAAVQTSATGDYTLAVTNSFGVQHVNIDSNFQAAAATGLLKLEDAPHVSGDAGVLFLAVRNDLASTSLTSANGDNSPVSVDVAGSVFVRTGFREDDPSSNGDSGFPLLAIRADTPAVDTSASGDYTNLKSNDVGAAYNEPSNKVATYGGTTTAGTSGGVPTTGVNVHTNAAKAKMISISSTLDVAVLISLDAGTTYITALPIGSTTLQTMLLDLGANGRWTASNIFAKAIGSNSAAGSIYVGTVI